MKPSTGFTKVPHEIFREANDLNKSELLVYLAILDSEISFMSIGSIGKRANVSKKTSQRAIESLLNKKWIRQINTSCQVSVRVARHSRVFNLSAKQLIEKTEKSLKKTIVSYKEIDHIGTPHAVVTMTMVSEGNRSHHDYGTVVNLSTDRSHHDYRTRTLKKNQKEESNFFQANGEFGDGHKTYQEILQKAGIRRQRKKTGDLAGKGEEKPEEDPFS